MARRQKNAMAIEGKARAVDACVDFLGSSKLRGLHNVPFVKLEDSDDGIPTVSAARSRLRGMTKMSSAEAMTDVQQSNRRRQGSREKGKLQSIPEDAGMGMRCLEQELLSSKLVLKEEKEEQEKRKREAKQEQGKRTRKRTTAREEDQDKYIVQEEEHKQRKSEEEQQQKQGKTATCRRRAPAKRAGFRCSPTIPPFIKASILSPIQESQWLDSVSSENLDPLRSDTPRVTLEENMFLKRTNCSPAITGNLGHLTAKTNSTRIPVKTVLKKDQAPSVRSSTCMKKEVNISWSLENDSNEKKFLLAAEVASTRAAAKRNISVEKLPSGTAKRVKKDPASMKEEISAPDTATNPSGMKRGTRYQLSKSLEALNIQGAATAQNQVDVKSTAVTEHKETSSAEKLECLTQNKGRKPVSNKRTLSRTAQKTKILKVAEESTFGSTMSLTGSPEPMLVVNAEGAATLINQVSMKSISATEPEEWSITNADSEFDNITQKKGKRNARRPFSKTAQEIKNLKMAEESTCLNSFPLAGGGSEGPCSKSSEVFYVQWAAIGQNQVNVKSIAAMEYEDKRSRDDITNNLECMTQNKGKKAVIKQRALSGAKKNKTLKMADCLDTFPLAAGGGNEQENPMSLGVPNVKGASIVQNQVKVKSMADMGSEQIRGSVHKVDADEKLDVKIQNRGRNTVTKKRALSGTAQKTKKLKISEEFTCSDILPLAGSPKPSEVITVEGAATAQNQVNMKAISATKPEEWNADDITNAYSKVEDILQNKGKEYVKKKRAMSFDALPVGFGLGISGWLPSPLSSEYTPEGVVDHLEVCKLVMDLQAQEMDPILNLQMSETLSEEAKKNQRLQEAAKKMGGDESLLGQGDMNSLHAYHSTSSTTESARRFGTATASATEGCAEQDTAKPIVLAGEHQQGKAKVKRQARKRTKASKALTTPLETTHTNSSIMLDDEGLESTTCLDHNDGPELEVRRSSRRRAAISCREKSTRNRKP